MRENLKKDRKEKDRDEPKKDKYFEEQCKELVEFKEVTSNGSNERKYTILLHSGFQKRVFNFRPGPSPISSDTDGVFICKLREAIIKFLDDYKIKYEKSERFDNFNKACDEVTGSATDLQPSSQESTNEATGSAKNLQPSSQESTYGSTIPATDLQPSSQYSTDGSTKKNELLSPETIAKGYEVVFGPPINQTNGGRLSRRRKAYKTTRRNNKYKNKKHYIKKRHTKRCKKSHRRRISRR